MESTPSSTSTDKSPPSKGKTWKQLVAGASSGIVTKTATAPLERVKIVHQLQGMVRLKEAMLSGASISPTDGKNAMRPTPPLKYEGILSTLQTIVREEGVLALYRGNGANVLRVIPVYSLKFAMNDWFKDLVRGGDAKRRLNFLELMLSGTFAGLFQTICTYPLETIRTRLTMGAAMGGNYSGIFDCVRKTWKHEGAKGFYKGLPPTLATGSPYVGLQMTFYELFRRALSPLTDKNDSALARNIKSMAAGAMSGISAQTITFPFDTVRRRMMINGMGGERRTYSSSWDCLVKVVRGEGLLTLFSGYKANVVRAIPAAACQFWAYDTAKALLGA